MRHLISGSKLGKNPAHRRAVIRNLVTNLIEKGRIQTTLRRAKVARPIAERMITLGKRGDLSARRQAGAYLMTKAAVTRLFDTVAPRFGDREGGYLRIIRAGWRKGDGADTAFVELLGSEKLQEEKREKRVAARSKRAEEAKRAMEEAEAQAQSQSEAAPAEGDEKKE